MPLFATEGIFPNDTINLRAVMQWPHDAECRRHYYAADYANGFVYEADRSANYQWRAALIQDLLEAPSWSELKRMSAQCTKRAIVAGYIFTFMFLMDRLKEKLPRRGAEGASISKAMFLAEQWAKQGATYGDGTKMLASETTVKECWLEYRDVAHFWAAMEINRISNFAPPLEVLHPKHFVNFMRTAAYLQMFGTTLALVNKSNPKQSPKSLLSTASAWLIDTEQYKPTIRFTDNLEIFDDAPFMKLLMQYKA